MDNDLGSLCVIPGGLAAPIPADDSQRIAALRQLRYLDRPPLEAFDRVTRLVAKVLCVPIALVSLVDEKRQWFKSRVGLEATQTPRDISFCGHAVFERQPLVVPDATLDPRFADNPLVTAAPHVRAYLGIPLYTREGHAVGTLCAIDRRPRSFDTDDVQTLSEFASIIEEVIHAQEVASHTEAVLNFAVERERLFRDTFDYTTVGIIHTSLAGSLIRVNGRAAALLGYSTEELSEKSFVDITHPDDVANNTAMFRRITAGEIDSYEVDKRYVRKDGSQFWGHLFVALKRAESGAPEYLISVLEDVSARKQAESDLRDARDALQAEVTQQTRKLHDTNSALRRHIKGLLESEQALRLAEHRLRAIADNLPALISNWSPDLRCVFANETYREWFGLAPAQIVGMTMRELLGDMMFDAAEPHVRTALDGREQRFERRLAKPDGSESHLEVHYIPDRDDVGGVRGFFVLAIDVTSAHDAQRALEAANARLSNDSTTDYLTGLGNRRAFAQRGDEAAQHFAKTGDAFGLILIDLDNFKQINDQYGHDSGDDVLRAVGAVLKRGLRNRRDFAARLGGEEFAVMCFGELDLEALSNVAERIRSQLVAELIATPKGTLTVTASFGVAMAFAGDSGWKNIYSRADGALYEAKASGKNRVVLGTRRAADVTGRFRALLAGTG